LNSREIENIPQHQWDLLADLYNNLNKDKLPPKQARPIMKTESSQSHIGTKTQKRRDGLKIQSTTSKKGRKSSKQLIQELGSYLIDTGLNATIEKHFQPQG